MFTPPTNDRPVPPKPPLEFGPLVYLGLPCALQIGYMYLLIAADHPLADIVDRGLRSSFGILAIVMFALGLTCATMWGFYEVAEWRHRQQ